MRYNPKQLLLVGCGNMGGALLTGWRANANLASMPVTILDPSPRQLPTDTYHYPDITHLPEDFSADVIVLAVKPQQLETTLCSLSRYAQSGTLWLSIAAGKTLEWLSERLPSGSVVVRAMPNTPAIIGEGTTVACANDAITGDQRIMAERLLSSVGYFAWIDDESMMNAVTALSGSGPAYVFLLLEALTKAGIELGLPEVLATRLAASAVRGSALLAERSHTSFDTLRANVTSPGGTTAAALEVLMHDTQGLVPLMKKALQAAANRSRELG